MKKIYWILVVLVLAALACTTVGGGGDSGTADNGAVQVPANDTAVEQPADVPADEAPAEAPVEEAVPEANSGNIRVSSDISDNSKCHSVFFPVNQETTWTYQADYDGDVTVYTIEISDITDESITSTMTMPEFSSTVLWYCGEDGLFSTDFAQFNFPVEMGDMLDIETVSYEGLTLPDEDLWEVGYTWDMSFEINMKFSIEGMEFETNAVADLTHVIAAVETVTVPAGTFNEAYRVEQTGTIMITSMGVELPAPVNTSTWYVRDVGMVKTVSVDEYGTSTTVLLSVE